MPEVRVFGSQSALNYALAEAVASTINSAVRARKKCAIALAGGTTPKRLYKLLATEFRNCWLAESRLESMAVTG